MDRPMIPSMPPYILVMFLTTLSICFSRFAQIFSMAIFSFFRSCCIVVNASTIASICCLKAGPERYLVEHLHLLVLAHDGQLGGRHLDKAGPERMGQASGKLMLADPDAFHPP